MLPCAAQHTFQEGLGGCKGVDGHQVDPQGGGRGEARKQDGYALQAGNELRRETPCSMFTPFR